MFDLLILSMAWKKGPNILCKHIFVHLGQIGLSRLQFMLDKQWKKQFIDFLNRNKIYYLTFLIL